MKLIIILIREDNFFIFMDQAEGLYVCLIARILIERNSFNQHFREKKF